MRHINKSIDTLEVNTIVGGGVYGGPTYGNKFYLDAAKGSNGNDGSEKMPFATLPYAYNKMTSGQGDTLYVYESTSALSITSNPAIAKNLCRFIGTSSGKLNMRSRISQSGTFSPFFTVSGYGNTFANLYFMHGTASTDYIGMNVTGDRNNFYNCHFLGPQVAAQGGHASFNGFQLTAGECYFEGCTFGNATIERDELTPNLTITVNSDGYSHHRFKDCTFLFAATDTDPYFIAVANTAGVVIAEFDNCKFIAMSSNMAVTPAVAITFSGGATAALIFNQTCQFVNVTNICASASHKFVHLPTIFAATADELNLIAKNNQTY